MRSIPNPVLAALLLLSVPAAASAATLSTVHVGANGGHIIDCVVTNVGDKDAEVAVTLYDFFGVAIVPQFEDCAGVPIPPKQACQVIISLDQDASCQVVGKGKLRAGIQVLDSGNGSALVEYVPATAK